MARRRGGYFDEFDEFNGAMLAKVYWTTLWAGVLWRVAGLVVCGEGEGMSLGEHVDVEGRIHESWIRRSGSEDGRICGAGNGGKAREKGSYLLVEGESVQVHRLARHRLAVKHIPSQSTRATCPGKSHSHTGNAVTHAQDRPLRVSRVNSIFPVTLLTL